MLGLALLQREEYSEAVKQLEKVGLQLKNLSLQMELFNDLRIL